MSSYATRDVKKVLSSRFAPLVRDLSAEVHRDAKGVHHAAGSVGRSCWTLTRDSGGRLPTPANTTLALKDLPEVEVCPSCMYSLGSTRGPYLSNRVAEAVLSHETVRTRITSMGKVTSSTSASAVQKRLGDVPALRRELAGIPTKDLPDELAEAIEALETLVDEVEKELKGYAQGDQARAKLERKVKDLMLPKRFKGQPLELDTTPTLVGISPTPTRPSDQVGAVLDAYAIRRDSVSVLVAPAYVYSFLLQQLFPKSSSNTLVVAAPAPDDESVREVVAGVWDPEGEGALACMHAAVRAGNALSAVPVG